MADQGELVVNLRANSGQFTRKMQQARGVVSDFALTATAAAVAGAGLGFIKLAADAEALHVRFKVLLGSGEQATNMLKELTERAASTPFQKMDLATGAAQLLGVGIAAEEVFDHMQLLGDVAAASGSRIQDLSSIYAKVQSGGRASLGDLNQLGDRAIPIFKALSEVTGVAEEDLRAYISAGNVAADDLTAAFRQMTSEGGAAFNGMAQLSETSAGKFSTLKDNATALGEEIGNVLLPFVSRLLSTTIQVIQQFKGWGQTIVVLGGALLAGVTAMRAITTATRAYAKAAAIATALSGKKGIAQLAIGLAAAAGAAYALDNALGDMNAEIAKAETHADAAGGEFTKLKEILSDPVDPAGVAGPAAAQNLDKLVQRVRSIRDEVLVLRGVMTETGIEVMRALEDGFAPEHVEQLARALNFRDALMQQQQMLEQQQQLREQMIATAKGQAASIRAAIETPGDKLKRKMTEATRLFEQGFISASELLAFDKLLNTETTTGQGRDQEQMVGRMAKGSAEAMKAIVMAGRTSPELTEAKKQTGHLKTLSEWSKRQQDRNEKLELRRQGGGVMAVVGSAQEHWVGQGGKYNGGIWAYTRVFQVKVDSKTDREDTVSGASGLPAYGDAHPGPIAAPAYARDISYDRWDSSTPLAWKVTVEYSSERSFDNNPANDEVLVSWTSEIYQEPIWEDTSGNAILNSAGDYFIDPSPTRDAAHLIAKISTNVTSIPTWVLSYQNAVNNAVITIDGLAIAIRTAKMQKLDIGQREKRGTTTFYPVSFEIHIRSEGWRFQPLDAGFREKDGTARKLIRNDGDGELPTSPVPLNGSGAVLANPTPATAVYGDFTIYPELAFSALPGIT